MHSTTNLYVSRADTVGIRLNRERDKKTERSMEWDVYARCMAYFDDLKGQDVS